MEEILRLKCQLESEVSSSDDILAALTILSAKNLSKDVLLSTKVGHTVNRLRRHGDSEEIRNQAKKVFRRWRTFVRDLEREKPIIDVHCDKKTEVLRGKARQLLADALQVTVSGCIAACFLYSPWCVLLTVYLGCGRPSRWVEEGCGVSYADIL